MSYELVGYFLLMNTFLMGVLLGYLIKAFQEKRRCNG